jgi:hypothetical protein
MERWEFHGSHPNMPNKVENISQPVMPPIPETVSVFGEEMPVSMESLLMAISEKLGLKAFGKNALGEGIDITRPEVLYLRCVANIALGDGPGKEFPDADAQGFHANAVMWTDSSLKNMSYCYVILKL